MELQRWAENVSVEHPGRFHPTLVWLVQRIALPLVRLCHRPTLTGLQNLPTDGPFLLVANHSGGLGLAEIFALLALYLRDVVPTRPIAAFAHPVGFHVWPLSRALRALGAIPSTYAAAAQALAAGVPILVFPGGDHETTRPIWQANRVDFGGRKGFLKIARTANVPIVPLGIRGGHMTAPVLFRWPFLATFFVVPRLILGVKRWAVSLLGVIGAVLIANYAPWAWWVRAMVIWLWLGSPLMFFAWIPWTLRMRIGEPISPAELFANVSPSDDLSAALARVQSRVQALVDR